MLRISFIENNKEKVLEGLKKRNFKNASDFIEKVLETDKKRKEVRTEMENTLATANKISKEIGMLYQSGKADEANLKKQESADLKQKSKDQAEEVSLLEKEVENLLYEIPNIPHESVPYGSTEEDNEEIFKEGIIPTLHDKALPHWELAKKYDIIDFELGVKITGAGFPVYKGKGAKLQRALIAYFLDKNSEAGYEEIQPPYLVNEASGIATGQLPDKEGQMYHDAKDDLYLIPTAEVPLTNMYRDELLIESDFPIKTTAYTPCFRREAGSYGAHVRGLNRLHQFDKVELVRIEHPNNSFTALDEMVNHVKEILNELELPYRILRLCGGDIGFTASLTFDFEVYSTAQERWLEVSSISNFESFQANRLKLRFKDENGKSQLAHTLNGSSLALPRILASILENYQTPEGIKIPKVLVPYTHFKMID
ncbi:MAG TPA: serine--tRNA ligase [Lutibacter sp.]|nr:serine--tRNA ligase [Lutibacter sp.]